MRTFDYIPCTSVAEACEALQEDGAQVIAGGTDLAIQLRQPDARSPRSLVDIARIRELREITSATDGISLGAASTHAEIARSAVLRSAAPLLPVACSSVGSPQIRNRGTVGGNIMNAAACADSVPPLIALGARVNLMSVKGGRVVSLSDLFEAPYRTRARSDELLTSVTFAPLPPGAGSVFLKLGRRNALSIARLSVAAILVTDQRGFVTEARIVPGAALPVWRRYTAAESLLVSERPSPALFAEAGKQVAAEMVSITGRRWSTEYKEPVLAVLVRRALEAALARSHATAHA